MATGVTLEKVLDLVSQFVRAQKGCWGHDEWEAFLGKAAKAGVEITDESKRSLGNLLEAAKFFYDDACSAAPKKPAAKKAAAKPAAKSAAKGKR